MAHHPRVIQFRMTGPEWDPLFAYADSQGITVSQAARELLLTSLATNANDAVYLATARVARNKMQQIAFAAASKAMRMAWEEMQAQALSAGLALEDL